MKWTRLERARELVQPCRILTVDEMLEAGLVALTEWTSGKDMEDNAATCPSRCM